MSRGRNACSGSMSVINRASSVGGWRADMLELETYFIWGQKVFSDWWISGNKHSLCHE